MAHHLLPIEAAYGGLAARQHGVMTIAQLGRAVKVLRLLRMHGYPAPIRQEVLDDDGEFAGRVDLAHPERRLIIEVQSYRCHDGARPLDADSARGNRHNEMGWVVMRATKKMLSGQGEAEFLRDLHRIYHRPLVAL